MNEILKQAFDIGDYVIWLGYKYIISESHEAPWGFYYYIDEANDMGYLNGMPFAAEVAQEELIMA